jgi:hypothetical protein
MASLNEIKAIAENIEKKMFPSFCQIISWKKLRIQVLFQWTVLNFPPWQRII